ncbi:MAG: hypothetical protein R6X34_26405 [Chloroflexota bacterium]
MTEQSKGSRNQIQTFLAVLRAEPTEADCERCLAQLNDYVENQLASGDYRREFPRTAQHLDGCVSCAEMYERVYALLWAERNGHFDRLGTDRLPQPAPIPEPDLSFLTPSATLWTALQTALQHSQQRLTLQLNAVLAALLVPQPTLAATRTGEDGRFGSQLLALNPDQLPQTELPFSLAAYADKQNPDLCLVEITVEPPGLSWPDLGGREVSVGYGEVAFTELTDDWGTAVFADIPLAALESLRLEIQLSNSEQ